MPAAERIEQAREHERRATAEIEAFARQRPVFEAESRALVDRAAEFEGTEAKLKERAAALDRREAELDERQAEVRQDAATALASVKKLIGARK